MKNIVKLGLILFIICVVAAGLLALTNGVTAPIITQGKLQEEIAAKQEVLPQGEEFKDMDLNKMTALFEKFSNENLSNVTQISTATSGGQFAGMVIKTSVKGFGGDIVILIGIDSNAKITTYRVLSHSETPGLGEKIKNESFINQFSAKSADENLAVVKRSVQKENEIQAITGATISSKAVTLAINSAIDAYNIIISEGGVK